MRKIPKPTKWFPKDIQEHIIKDINTIETIKRTKEEEEFDELNETIIEFYRAQMKKPLIEREMYSDGKGFYILLVTPERPPTEPKKSKNPFTGAMEYKFFCKFMKGNIYVSFPTEELKKVGWNNSAWIYGKYIEDFAIMGYTMDGKNKYYDSIEEALDAANAINEANDKPSINIEDLQESDILRGYIFNVWQVIYSQEKATPEEEEE